jgi:hypothetical protein
MTQKAIRLIYLLKLTKHINADIVVLENEALLTVYASR